MESIVENIIIAIERGRTDIVRSLVTTFQKEEVAEKGSLDQLLNSSLTPSGTMLHYAAQLGHADLVRTLLAAGSDPGVHNDMGKTPLDLAANDKIRDVFSEDLLQSIAHSNIGRICQLIAAGVDPNLHDSPSTRNTPLHWAAAYGNRDVIQCLCKRGSNVNAANACGTTALHDAMERGDLGVVQELLQSGALLHLKAINGKYAEKTPLDMARDKPDILNFIHEQYPSSATNGVVDETVTSDTDLTRMDHIDTPVTSPLVVNGPVFNNSLTINSVPSDVSLMSNCSGVAEATREDDRLDLVWPRPRKLLRKEGRPFLPQRILPVYISCATHREITCKVIRMWQRHRKQFELRNLDLQVEPLSPEVATDPHVLCEINRRLQTHEGGYRLSVSHRLVKLQAGDESSLLYGISTLLQLLTLCQADGIPPLQIFDHPSLKDRGVLIDMSKGRIPQLESLKCLIQTLAYIKVNQVYLYYRLQVPQDPEKLWLFHYSRSTILDLDNFCQDLCVMLIPVVDVTPKTTYEDLASVRESLHLFLDCFTSSSIIGVGPRLSTLVVDIAEDGRLSLDDSRRFLPLEAHCTLQLCAFTFHDNPKLLEQLPFNTMLVEYGFQAGYDFDNSCEKYSMAGVPFYIMSGTAAWNSLAGCPEAAVSNSYTAACSAVSRDALGLIVSHWSGASNVTHQTVCWPALLTAAGVSWNSDVPLEFLRGHLAGFINHHCLSDLSCVTGQVIIELGRAETYVFRCSRNQTVVDNSGLPPENGSILYQLLLHPDQVDLERLTPDIFQKTMRHIRKCQSELTKADVRCSRGSEITAELQLTADLMLSACRIGRSLVSIGKNPSGQTGYAVVNLGVSNLPPTTRTDLANRMLSQVETYRRVWLSLNLDAGLQESLLMLTKTLQQFVPDGDNHSLAHISNSTKSSPLHVAV